MAATDYGYGDYQAKLSPGFLQGTNGAAWQTALGDEKSNQLDLMRQAATADFPGVGPDDGLDLVGADRVLPRAVGELTSDYAERLRTAWDSPSGWTYAGSHGSLLLALARAGFPTGLAIGAVIIQRTKIYSYLDGAPGSYSVTFGQHNGWTFNEQGTEFWNQFGLMFGSDVGGLDVGTPKARVLNAIVRAWKPAKARFMGTNVVVSGAIWGWPFGVNWGDPGRLWGGVTKNIPPD